MRVSDSNPEERFGNHSSQLREDGVRKVSSRKKSSFLDNKTAERIYNVEFGDANALVAQNRLYGDNTITTTKYNLLTFSPKSLFFQFKRAANIYFLIVTILTCMSFSPKQPSSMIGTFAFVLVATMVKDAIEDYGRYKQDSLSNNKMVLKYTSKDWQNVKCYTLRPGDIIKVRKEEEFSCDTLLIKSSNQNGYCYIDTKNLDGETNLKEKCALEEFKDCTENDVTFKQMMGNIRTTPSDANLQDWEGIISYRNVQDNIYCQLHNLALKGCVLKNTDSTIGIVVYAGHNTKIMKNSKHPKQKFSKIMKTMNRLLYSLFAFDIVICIVFGCLSFVFVINNGPYYAYIFPKYNPEDISNLPGVRFGYTFLTFFVAYSQIIPISLYVAMEIIKIVQGVLIFYDADMYDIELKKPASCRATDLIEELGQIDFVFSDKTGTLTQNNMVFKRCYVNRKVYGAITEQKDDLKRSINGDPTAALILSSDAITKEDQRDKLMLDQFFTLLALCHSVFPEGTDAGIMYQGNSPDDIALVKGAQQLGYEFLAKEFNDIIIRNHLTDETTIYEKLTEIPFSSDRKRMSVIVMEKKTKQKLLLSKGADGVMLNGSQGANSVITRFNYDDELSDCKKILDAFSKEGLRILVMGQKYLDDRTFEYWIKRHNDARSKNLDRLEEVYAEIERDLHFVGCSAIEDKLQEGVPDTIHTLLHCGIRVWVLTGDKQDTAEQIARQCKLINEEMTLINLTIQNPNVYAVKELLNTLVFNYDLFRFQEDNALNLEEINEAVRRDGEVDSISLIIDGLTLEVILSNQELSRMFFLISVVARSVVCCRVSPKQKSEVVKLAKMYGDWVTLAIGDGANDVPMIMEASIGVGIQGKEGTQAARSADYAIGQFRFLEKLVLYYGRNGYVKVSKFICYYFYKNIILSVTELFFAFYDGFSGQIYFAEYLGTMFNAIFTSWPCLFTFSLERDHDPSMCKIFPILYRAGPMNIYFNFKVFWTYIFYAFVHSALAFYIPCQGMTGITGTDGVIYSHWRVSTISFCLVIHIVTAKLLIISDFWNLLNIISTLFSLGFFYLILVFLCSDFFGKMFQPELVGVTSDILTNFKSLVMIIVGSFLITLPDIIFKQVFYYLYPTPSQLIVRYRNTPEMAKVINDFTFKKTNSSKSMTIRNETLVNPHNGSIKCLKTLNELAEMSRIHLKGTEPNVLINNNDCSIHGNPELKVIVTNSSDKGQIDPLKAMYMDNKEFSQLKFIQNNFEREKNQKERFRDMHRKSCTSFQENYEIIRMDPENPNEIKEPKSENKGSSH